MLTEHEISRTWRALFHEGEVGEDTFVRAEALLDELRAESPLRHRLESELTEIRKIRKQKQQKQQKVAAPRAR